MRVTLLNLFYLPDISPTAHLAASLAEHRAARGDKVTVVAGKGSYARVNGGRAEPRGVQVSRIPTAGFGKANALGRIADYLMFYVLALVRVLVLPRQDVVVAMTTPPFVVLIGLAHKLFHRRTMLVLWVMDCYPEVLEMAGVARKGGIVGRALRAINRFVFKHVDHVVCLDEAMVDLLRPYVQVPERPPLTVIPNWERADMFPGAVSYPEWSGVAEHGLRGKFVVVYLGNAGAGHEVSTVLAAAEQLRGEPVVFLFVGGGSKWQGLTTARQERGLENIVILGYVAKEQTGALMAGCHAALITLREDAAGLISPSKLHAYLAIGLPVLYIGPPKSNVDSAIQTYGVGRSVRVGDASGVADFIRCLQADAELRAGFCLRSRTAFDSQYCDSCTLPQFDKILDNRSRQPVWAEITK